MKILKYSINFIISFLIVFAIIFVIGVNFLNNKILNKDYVISKLEESEFYLQISREVESGFENYIYQSGFPEDTVKNIFTEEMIKNDVNSLINYLYDGTEINLSTDLLRQNLETKIQEYVNSENIILSEQNTKNINKFEDLIVNEYSKNINVSNTLYEKGNSIIQKLESVSSKLGNLPVIILIVLVAILIIINIKDLLVAINFAGISLLTVGVVLKLGISLILKNIEIDNLMIITKSLSNLAKCIIKECLYQLSEYGNIFVVCGIVGILVFAILKNTDEKKEKPKRRFAN